MCVTLFTGLIATDAMSSRVIAPTIKDYQGQAQLETEALKIQQHVPEVSIDKKTYSRKEILEALSAVVKKYGLDYQKFYNTVKDESTFDPYAISPNGLSVGISQYIIETWLKNCSNKDDRTNPFKALDCQGRMWNQGKMGQWDAFCNLYPDLICTKRGLYVGFLNK